MVTERFLPLEEERVSGLTQEERLRRTRERRKRQRELPVAEIPPVPEAPEPALTPLERLYPEMFDPEASYGLTREELPTAVMQTLTGWEEEDPEGFLEDLLSRPREDVEDFLLDLGATPEDVVELLAPVVTTPPQFAVPNWLTLDFWKEALFKPYAGEDLAGKAYFSFVAGIGDVISTTGGAARWLGFEDVGGVLSTIGSTIQQVAPPDTTGEFEMADMLDPEFYATKVTRTIPFALSLAPMAIGGFYGGSAVATTLGLGRLGAWLVGGFAGAALSRPLESALEAGSQYDDAIARGKTEKEAKEEADEVFRKNMTLAGMDAFQIAIALAPTPKWVPSGLVRAGLVRTTRIGGKMVIVGLTEGGEEVYQDMVQRHARGEEWQLDPISKEVFAIGMVMGLGMGLGGDVVTGLADNVKKKMTPDIKTDFDVAVSDYEAEGFRTDQSELKALDTISQTPEGEKVVTETLKEIQEEAPVIPEVPEVVPEVKPLTGDVWNISPIEDWALWARTAGLEEELGSKAWAELTTEEQDAIRLAREEIAPEVITPEVIPNILPVEEVSKLETRIPLDLIRKDESAEIERLTDEIKREGVKEPITIRVREDGSQVVWDGIHRLIVAQDLGIKNIPIKYIGEISKLAIPKAVPPVVEEVKPPEEAPERIVYSEGGFPVSPEETISQDVVDNIPILQDIGAKERVRPTRKVFERMGLYETYKGIQKAEVELGEANVAFNKRLKEASKLVDKERRSLVFQELENPGSVVGLTFNEKRAVNFFRENFNKWADSLNLPQEKRVKNYVTHIFEADIVEQLKEKHPLDPALARALEYKAPKTIFNPFLQERLGATVGLVEDPFAAASAYESRQLKVLYYEPFVQKIGTIANDPEQHRAVRDYLKDYSRRMTSVPSKLDLDINKDLQELAGKLRGLPGGETLANFLSKGNPSGWASYNFTSAIYTLWLGFKPTSAIRNLSQHTLIIGEVGPVHFADGLGMRFTKEGKQALSESLVLRSRKAAFVPGIDDSFATQWTDKFRETALWMFRQADKQNVSDAFLAGYSEAKKLLPNADRQVWIDRGDEVAADTQYLYTKMNSMAISQSAPGRVFSILTTWSENWVELMSKWISRRPSQIYLQHEKATGEKVAGANWATSYKAILMYMLIIGLGFALKEETRLKAWEYTGLTSVRYLADIAGGDFPGLQYIGAAANLIAGFVTDDERRLKEGLNQLNPVKMAGILRQLESVALGDKDWLTLLFYLEGKDYKIKQLEEKWEKEFKAYPLFKDKEGEYDPELKLEYIRTHPKQAGWSDAKIRSQWREDNPLLEAKMFVVGQFTTLSTDEARAEVLNLIQKHKLDPDLIKGYDKVFGGDVSEKLGGFKNRIGNLEKFVVGEEAEYFTVGNYVTELNSAVKIHGRQMVEKNGTPFAVEILRAQDSFVQYEEQEPDGRKLYRQQFPDVEALLYLTGKVQSFANPKSAEILLGLMEKYDIPPEGIRAFIDKPERYDELFTQKFKLEQQWFDQSTEYENYGNTESPIYIEDKEERKLVRAKFKEDNPNWVADMRRVEAIDHDATPEIIEKWAERGKTIDGFSAGSSEAMVWLLDNPDTFKWALEQELLTDDGSDWNVPALRINAKWREQDDSYDALETTSERQEYLLKHEDYRKDRRRREAYGDEFSEDQIENFVSYWELPVGGYRQERFLLDNPEFASTMHEIKGIDLPDPKKVPAVQYDEIYEKWQADFDKLDSLSDHESPFYIEDTEARDKAREAMRLKVGKLTDFGKAEIRREAYGKILPEKHIESYVGYYSIIAEGKPEKDELWYDDDWFLMEHKDFYKEVYLKIQGNERADFRKVPSREVYAHYLGYQDRPTGKMRDDYRWRLWDVKKEKDFEKWLLDTGKVTVHIRDKKLREELTPTERWKIEVWERERGFKASLEEIEKKLKELTE